MLKYRTNSLGSKIFTSMLTLVLIAFAIITGITYYQYREQIRDYNSDRLERKENSIKKEISRTLKATSFELITEKIPYIFKDEIFEISRIHGENISIYDLNGNLLISSTERLFNTPKREVIAPALLDSISRTIDKRFVKKIIGQPAQQLSYSYINDPWFKPLGILQIQYENTESFINKELRELLWRLGAAASIILIIAIFLAYILARYITKRLLRLEENIKQTELDKRNKKLNTIDLPIELVTLVSAYNGMIDQLENSAAQLAQSEREAAWREMAKQVAHEIKNPLTPMRLTVQMFERKFDPNDDQIHQKIKSFSNTLIEQIDTMSSIASAFSNFAAMPAQQSEVLLVSDIVKLALDIFTERNIAFAKAETVIYAKFDRTQLIRVVTNLVKNAIQATQTVKNPKINVAVFEENQNACITVTDNGLGISKENKQKIFEPKFTTKTSGMGLGLAMVKNIVETYKGSITFVSQEGHGTTFKVTFPKQ